MFLIAVAVVTQGLRTRPRGRELGVMIGVGAAYLLAFTRIASPAERTHLIEYGLVAVLVYEALMERTLQGRRVPTPALLAVLITTTLGALDECIQAVLPNRFFDPRDLLFNTLASVMAVTACLCLRWVRGDSGHHDANKLDGG
ncbi:MAG: VanZ family protein, partial [Myxococcota bacterium]